MGGAGVKVGLPEGVVGLVVRDMPPPQDMSEQYQSNKLWSVESEFREMSLWEHDNFPPKDHAIQQIKDWYQIAQAVGR